MTKNLFNRTALFLVLALPALSDTVYQVTLDTSALNPSMTWLLDYQQVASDLPAENSVTLSNFNFGGGSYIASQSLNGDVSGSFGTQYVLTDPADLSVSNLSELLIQFVPGSQLTFDLSYTNSFSGSPTATPDTFSWAVEYCDPAGQNCTLPLSPSAIPTTISDPSGPSLGSSLLLSLDGIPADAVSQPFAASSQFNNITPDISVLQSPVTGTPEPGGPMVVASALVICVILRKTFGLRRSA